MGKMGFDEPLLTTEYVGVQQGWAVVGGQKCYFKSKLELRWAQYLEFLKQAGEIIEWQYEPKKFEFEGIRSGTVFYTPDFKVKYPKSTIGITYLYEHLWHEVKGHLTQRDVTKFRRMQHYYPDEKIILVMQRVPPTHSRSKSAQKLRVKLFKAEKYVERIIDAEKTLKQAGF